MGTDIYSIAQVKRDGKWVTVAINIDGDQRSYNTFAMLANVRNGTGFAGCRFPVIHEPRGLPDDTDQEWLGNHSFSWCTLAELRAFIENVAKKTETFLVGVVSRADYEEHHKTGKPYETWCEMISEPGVFVADRVGVVYQEGGLADFYTLVHTSWPVNAAEQSRLCQIETALSLVANRAGVDADNLRFVYGFDF